MAALTTKLANLNPFSKTSSAEQGDDKGEKIDEGTLGGGRGSRKSDVVKRELRVSHALKSFLVYQKVLSSKDSGADDNSAPHALLALLEKPHSAIPRELLDRSHPLPEYFVSSSHNTYLTSEQLYGTSSASAYATALKTGSRCVEIDAWDNDSDKEEPKVTHGYTLVSHISFRQVCETIRDILDEEKSVAAADPRSAPVAPILISLENHCSAAGQKRLADISIEVFGDRLLTEPVQAEITPGEDKTGDHVPLGEIGPRVVFIVEYHLVDERESSDDEEEEEEEGHENEDEKAKKARAEYEARKKKETPSTIIPELAALGVYAQSVKPSDNSWFDPGKLKNGPHHHLINVSESGLSAHLPTNGSMIARSNATHLMRVYPKGTRIGSSNLKPVPYWGIGAQVCALNWQTFGTSNQLNAAMFDGSEGYVLKPASLRAGGDGSSAVTGRKTRLRLHVAGATDIPVHGDDAVAKGMKPYVTCTLYHPNSLTNEPPKRKTAPYKHHKLGFLHQGDNPAATDPVWDEVLHWEYDESELVFLRLLVKSDDAWARNPMYAVAAVRLSYVVPGWTFVRMLDMKGRESDCTLLLKFEFSEA